MTTATTVRPVPIDPVTARLLATTAAKAAKTTVERDRLIGEAFKAGASMREIGRAINMTHPGVRSILIRDGHDRGVSAEGVAACRCDPLGAPLLGLLGGAAGDGAPLA